MRGPINSTTQSFEEGASIREVASSSLVALECPKRVLEQLDLQV